VLTKHIDYVLFIGHAGQVSHGYNNYFDCARHIDYF
jgi:hypothetical protein